MNPHTIRRILPAAIVAATAALAVAAGPASAAKPIVHQTPKVPVVVDGKHLAPKQIHRFDGKPLYTRMSADGKTLIATTEPREVQGVPEDQGRHDAAAGRQGAGQGPHQRRRPLGADLHGQLPARQRHTINSGLGVANMNAISGCDWFNCWFFENSVSSIDTYGRARSCTTCRTSTRTTARLHRREHAADLAGLRLQRSPLVGLHRLVGRPVATTRPRSGGASSSFQRRAIRVTANAHAVNTPPTRTG